MPAGEIPHTPSVPGEVPERFKDAGEVVTLCAMMISADQRRAPWRASVERLWAGEPVYPLSKLQAMGQSWRARTNYRGLEGLISENCTLDYDAETQGEQIVCIYLDAPPSQEVEDWERIMASEFKWMLQCRWANGYNFHIPKRQFQRNIHGLGIHVWPEDHTGNWIPRTPSAGEVMFPDDCPFNFMEDGDYFMLRDFVPSYKLYRYIENEKEAKALGWDTDIVWKALTLINKNSGQNPYGAPNVDWMARQYAQGDIGYWTTRQSGVWINSIFVREYETGKVSQYSIAEGLPLSSFLYKKRNKYDEWPIEIFPYDIGNGNIHSVKGLGDRTKDFYEMMNRMQNAGVDQVMISAYPNMKQAIQNMDPDKMKLAKIGGLNWLPYGAEPQVVQFPDLEKGLLAMKGDLQGTLVQNNRMAGQVQIEQQDRMTAGEYLMRSQDGNHLSTASLAMHKAHLDSFYKRIVTHCAKPSGSSKPWAVMAKEWRQRCIRRGVPADAFKNIAEVTAVLAYGKGSASARTNAYRELFQSPVYLQAGSDRQIAIERGYVGSMLGQSAVEQYCRSINDENIPDADDSFAVQENNALVQGGDALAAPRQDQIEHLETHFAKAAQIAQAYAQGQMDPQAVYTAIVAFGQHTKQHLDLLRSNPIKKQDFQHFFNQWQQLARMADKLQADIESAQEATPPEQQMSEDLQLGMAKVQQQGQLQQLKLMNSNELKQRQQAHREQMDRVKLQAQQERDNVKLLHEVQRSTVETGASIAQDTALTQADINNKRRKAEAAA